MAGITASWALAQTADGALKLSRDAAIAASDDNVQPIALVACERFGATLAISRLTQRKIENMIRQQTLSHFQKFLLAKIGYAKGGSIDALSKSTAGIRFLSLAAALISTCNIYDAATTLKEMIQDTAEDKELSPTTYQLKDLLDVLEPKLNRARFLDEVEGFQTLLLEKTNQTVKAVRAGIVIPSPEAIHELVKSFRELSRLGNEDTQTLKITVGPFAAWVCAFARWSVEIPPRICYELDSDVIIDQPGSKVTIRISKNAMYETNIEIETTRSYSHIQKVVNALVDNKTTQYLATGMVGLKAFARLTLRELGLSDELGLRACKQVLPYALHFIKSTFTAKFELQKSTSSTMSVLNSLNPFPDDEVIIAVMEKYVGVDKSELKHEDGKTSLRRLEKGTKLGDLPVVRLWIEEHKSVLETKPAEEFNRLLSFVVADILALSLIMDEELCSKTETEILLLHNHHRLLSPRYHVGCEWLDYVGDMLQANELQIGYHNPPKPIFVDNIINWALKLVGHDVDSDIEKLKWVVSSFRGQVLLPRILLADEIPSTGFACLSYFLGTLMLENQKDRQFSRILSRGTRFAMTKLGGATILSAQLNAFPKETIKWEMSSTAEHLEISMGWTLNKNNQLPLNTIRALSASVMTAQCSHSVDTKLSIQARPVILPPGSNRLYDGYRIEDSQMAVYPLFGNEGLKLLALASIVDMRGNVPFEKPLAIINRGACIDCVFGMCSFIDCSYLIL